MKLTAGTLVTRINEIQEITRKEYNSEERKKAEMKLTAGTLVTRINEIQESSKKNTRY